MDASQLYIKQQIEQSLRALAQGSDLFKVAPIFFEALGYRSERIGPLDSSTPEEFLKQHLPHSLQRKERSKAEKFFIKKVQAIKILFQVTDEEITNTAQMSLLEPKEFEKGRAESFLFVATDLRNTDYSRSEYAQLTREISKSFLMPVFVLFRRGDLVSLAFADRRPSRKVGEEKRDVLEKVSLLQQINCLEPHAGHRNILAALSLNERIKWIKTEKEKVSFDSLHKALLDELDTRELTKRFYKELSTWFYWAVQEAEFPRAKDANRENHLIRLITRMLFVWFIKEKNLVSDKLFNEEVMSDLLKNFGDENGNYYRAILQNLFFATLNTEIEKRAFSSERRKTHRNFNLYRYADLIQDRERFLSLMQKTPFINGGLFDCLDSEEGIRSRAYRVDCFTDNKKQRKDLLVPDKLFFDRKQGLLPLFQRYKFTVEESTPIEQEVALDPELLGKVFENLLAAYNPETRETARQQTGSYYTPRAVVDYMVDESLLAYLGGKVTPGDGDSKFWQDRLCYLLDYAAAFDDAAELFSLQERKDLVQAVADIKVLDPAVGSGAFPMGILHKLVLILSRLDKTNTLWQKVQKTCAMKKTSAAYDNPDSSESEARVAEIQDTFPRNSLDFGRKLFLIQNSIFGVDIQPVACQIAKLRFFISLAIEQQTNGDSDNNYGIEPLPNLETRFVAANSLLGIASKGETIVTSKISRIEEELGNIRKNHFNASTRKEKLRLTREFKDKQRMLSDELKGLGFEDGLANKVAAWDPFDQNSAADWFDPEWMFGEKDGFDVVIGNPPYVESRNKLLTKEMKDLYQKEVISDWGLPLPRGSDLLIYFYTKAPKFLRELGTGFFITQNSWLNTNYGISFQKFTLKKFSIFKVIDTTSKFFLSQDGPNINTIITGFSRNINKDMVYKTINESMDIVAEKKINRTALINNRRSWGALFSTPDFYDKMLNKIQDQCKLINFQTSTLYGQGINVNQKMFNTDQTSGVYQYFLSKISSL